MLALIGKLAKLSNQKHTWMASRVCNDQVGVSDVCVRTNLTVNAMCNVCIHQTFVLYVTSETNSVRILYY
jgi:hypothetical protein